MRLSSSRVDAALYVPSLRGGGAERVMVEIAGGLSRRGHRVALVLGEAKGAYLEHVCSDIEVVSLGTPRVTTSFVPLVFALRKLRPRAVLSTMNHANVLAIAASRLAQLDCRIVVREATCISVQVAGTADWRTRLTPWAVKLMYPLADQVIAVSRAAADDFAQVVGYRRDRIEVIYNPIDLVRVRDEAQAMVDESVFGDHGGPTVVSVGRLSPEKDHATMIRAVRRLQDVRLVILGEGEEREPLQSLVSRMGLSERVAMPGFVANPYAYIAKADALALTSRFEGLPNVLIQALVLGTPVVATDAPGGAREILMDGMLGRLVPVGDDHAIAEALRQSFFSPPPTLPTGWLDRFSTDAVVERYAVALGLEAPLAEQARGVA